MDHQRLQGYQEGNTGATIGRLSPTAIAEVLDDAAGHLLERHLEQSKEWFPHELVPWELGKRFGTGETPPPPDHPLPEGVRSALFVNLLTEDNLPHYFAALADAFRSCSALGEWSRRWAAEEQRHAIVLRDWICVTRHLDLVGLERARMRQLTSGFEPGVRARGLLDGVVYLALQELATRVSHWNTGRLLDSDGAEVMKRISADENRHYLFYRELVSAALGADPSSTVEAIDRQVTAFEMPGTLIEDFSRHARAIAAAGIYDLRLHHDQVLKPLVSTHWHLEATGSLDAAAEQSRSHLFARMDRLRRVIERMEPGSGLAGSESGPATLAPVRS
jgi:acyl-[acyl-carrier-protein] desaturase